MTWGGYTRGRKDHRQEDNLKGRPKQTVKSISSLPYADMEERGIRPEVVEHFNVRMSRSEEDGFTPTAYYFPYYDGKGVLCGWKKKDLTLAKNDSYHYTTIGKQGVSCMLFGQREAQHVERKRKLLVVCEGEVDTLSVYQIAVDKVAGTKYAGMEPFVVSLSSGTANAVENIIHNQAFIEGFEKVVLAFDADESTPKEKSKGIIRGKECTELVANHLMGENVYVASQPEGCKDANEALLEGGKSLSQLYSNYFFEAEPYRAEKIITPHEVSFEEIIAERPEGVRVDGFPKLMDMICGFRRRELSVITSLSGSGKSSVVSSWAYSLAKNGFKVGMIFLEEEDRDTIQRVLAHRLEVPYNKFRKAPLKYKTQEEIREAYEWMGDKYVFLDHFGSLRTEELLNKIKMMMYMYKVDFIILDHLSMVISGNKTDNERKDMDVLMTELAAFVASNDVGILAVSHLNRSAADEMKGISQLKEPMWVKVKKENMRSSSALEQLSWMVFGIDLEIMPDRRRGRIRLTCLKNRPHGILGEADIVQMNPQTGVIESAEEDFEGAIDF